ncbi:ABC transporter permease subunit [uncultured Vibrio sp.]|uniref:ABC transporter permease n=1 Tax=uncultured Vibrio sp. TaxID=114054 RepID=UPI0029C6A31F|nr:ABC transporter permease subunit [uncultured Vibrio sp.]
MTDFIAKVAPMLLDGAWMTLKITFISVSIAALLALPMSLLRVQPSQFYRWPVQLFISFFRGTPLIAQLFLLYYGSGQFRPWLMEMGMWGFFRDPVNCALLVFALNSLAYQTEILRGAIQSVDAGEIEAAKSMGMNNSLLYRRIVMPLAYRIAFPALGNECILMLKGGAVASVITVMDLMGQTRRAFSQTFDISTYFLAAAMYLVIATAFVLAWRQAERYLYRHQIQRTPGAKPATVATT